MRKIQCYVTMLLLVFSFTACTQRQSLETESTPIEIAEAVINSQSAIPTLSKLISGDEEFNAYISDYYLLDSEKVNEGVICYAEGVEASEIAVLVLKDESDAKLIEERLFAYIKNRAGVFEGYAPQQAALVKNGVVVINGKYVALFICEDTSAAKTAFLNCFEDNEITSSMEEIASTPIVETEETTKSVVNEITQTPTTVSQAENSSSLSNVNDTGSKTADNINREIKGNINSKNKQSNSGGQSSSINAMETEKTTDSVMTENYYDSAAVLQAWRSKDTSSLSNMNLSILNAAEDVIKKEIKADMSDYEKELAIHDWITGWSSFDYSVFGHSSSDGFKEGSDTPYGVLINREGMCHGYSSTFQLFMDMLDIECITVFGKPGSNGVEHSWNMIKLNGEWYCVDVAWDDPIGGMRNHDFFNVTSQYLRDSGIHKWDESTVPEATAITYSFSN